MNESLIHLNQFDIRDKNYILQNPEIDKGIKELVNAINEIEVFYTMNSCQGELIPEEAADHCPKTYVDFYVLHHQYHIGNKLFNQLVNEFGSLLNCQISFEPDFDFIDEDTVEDNGLVNLRYRLELYVNQCKNAQQVYNDLVEAVNKFNS